MSKTSRQAITSSANTPIDFKVDPKTGVGYISQRKVAELLGISQSSISRLVQKSSHRFFVNETNQLDEDSLVKLITYYAEKGNKKAVTLLSAFAKAGARAFIYHQAGVPLAKPTPKRDLPPPPSSLPPLPPPPPTDGKLNGDGKHELRLTTPDGFVFHPWVYLARMSNGTFKIGFSADVLTRAQTLGGRIYSAASHAHAFQVEQAAHAFFKPYSLGGEHYGADLPVDAVSRFIQMGLSA